MRGLAQAGASCRRAAPGRRRAAPRRPRSTSSSFESTHHVLRVLERRLAIKYRAARYDDVCAEARHFGNVVAGDAPVYANEQIVPGLLLELLHALARRGGEFLSAPAWIDG